MRRGAALLLGAALSGCATAPVRPDAAADPRGEWAVVAVNGQPTGGWAGYRLAITPPTGSAQFGCNSGSGALTVYNGWVTAGDWIITVAGCRSKDIAELERAGFNILARPMAVQRLGQGFRLRNARGTIDVAPRVTPSLGGRWRVIMVNDREVQGAAQFKLPQLTVSFGCNDGRGAFEQAGDRLRPLPPGLATTERGCMNPDGSPSQAMQHEDEGFRIAARPMRVEFFAVDRVRLSNEAGTMDLRR